MHQILAKQNNLWPTYDNLNIKYLELSAILDFKIGDFNQYTPPGSPKAPTFQISSK